MVKSVEQSPGTKFQEMFEIFSERTQDGKMVYLPTGVVDF